MIFLLFAPKIGMQKNSSYRSTLCAYPLFLLLWYGGCAFYGPCPADGYAAAPPRQSSLLFLRADILNPAQ